MSGTYSAEEFTMMQNMYIDAKQQLIEAQDKLKKIQKEGGGGEANLKDSKDSQELQKKFQVVSRENEKLKEEKEEQFKIFNQMAKENEELKKSNAEEQVKKLTQKNEEINWKLEERQKSLKLMSEENDKLTEKLKEVQETLKSLERDNQLQKQNLDTSMKLREKIIKEKEELAQQILQLQENHKQELDQMNKMNETQVNKLQKEKQQLEQQIQNMEKEKQDEIQKIKQEAEQKNTQLLTDKEELEKKIQDSEELVQQAEQRIQDKETETKITLKKNERLIKELKDQLNREKKKVENIAHSAPSSSPRKLPSSLPAPNLNSKSNNNQSQLTNNDVPANSPSKNIPLSPEQLQDELNQTVMKMGNLQSANFDLEEQNKQLRLALKQKEMDVEKKTIALKEAISRHKPLGRSTPEMEKNKKMIAQKTQQPSSPFGVVGSVLGFGGESAESQKEKEQMQTVYTESVMKNIELQQQLKILGNEVETLSEENERLKKELVEQKASSKEEVLSSEN